MSKHVYLVEMQCDAREVYSVEADSPEEAAANWMNGSLFVSEVDAGTVVSVELEPGSE